MTREEVMKTLNEIFCDVFDDDSIVLTDETNSSDIDDWDSLEQINLIVNIENEFGMVFDMAEVSEKAKADYKANHKEKLNDIKVYVKPEDGKAYYTANGGNISGSVAL